jgi:hypothetical protein
MGKDLQILVGKGEMVISAFIGLVGLGPASRVFTFHLLDSLLTTITKIPICLIKYLLCY